MKLLYVLVALCLAGCNSVREVPIASEDGLVGFKTFHNRRLIRYIQVAPNLNEFELARFAIDIQAANSAIGGDLPAGQLSASEVYWEQEVILKNPVLSTVVAPIYLPQMAVADAWLHEDSETISKAIATIQTATEDLDNALLRRLQAIADPRFGDFPQAPGALKIRLERPQLIDGATASGAQVGGLIVPILAQNPKLHLSLRIHYALIDQATGTRLVWGMIDHLSTQKQRVVAWAQGDGAAIRKEIGTLAEKLASDLQEGCTIR
jgi:hypothetical protein